MAASTTTLATQLGGSDVATSPLLLWNRELLADRTATPQLRSAPVTTAMHTLTTAIGTTCGRSSPGGKSARRRIAPAAQATAPEAASRASTTIPAMARLPPE